jgi:hypothetical protein
MSNSRFRVRGVKRSGRYASKSADSTRRMAARAYLGRGGAGGAVLETGNPLAQVHNRLEYQTEMHTSFLSTPEEAETTGGGFLGRLGACSDFSQ